ncbi:SixA phosphatase family protein [Kitasatospora sp. NPDC094028]
MDAVRTLVVLRHAKSAWPDVPDAERPLAPRGRRDAPAAGAWLSEAALLPDLVVCSPARRAAETFELACGQWRRRPPVAFDPRVYGADAAGLVEVLRDVEEAVGTLLLIGHQPALQDLVLDLSAGTRGEAVERLRRKFPTCGLAVVRIAWPWTRLGPGAGRLVDFAVPRG